MDRLVEGYLNFEGVVKLWAVTENIQIHAYVTAS